MRALVPWAPHAVADDVVVEVATVRHSVDDVEELRLGVASGIHEAEPLVVPAQTIGGRVPGKGIALSRQDGEYDAGPAAIVGEERRIVVRATKRVAPAASDMAIEIGVEREEHAHISVAIDPKDEQIAIVIGSDFDLDSVTRAVVAAIEGEPDLVIGRQANNPGRYTGRGRGEQGE